MYYLVYSKMIIMGNEEVWHHVSSYHDHYLNSSYHHSHVYTQYVIILESKLTGG